MTTARTALFVFIALLNSAQIGRAQGPTGEEAAATMAAAGGLRATLSASEPEVRQPIFVKCDDRGSTFPEDRVAHVETFVVAPPRVADLVTNAASMTWSTANP